MLDLSTLLISYCRKFWIRFLVLLAPLSLSASMAPIELDQMTLQEKLAQLFIAFVYTDPEHDNVEDVEKILTHHPVGGIIFSKGTLKGQQNAVERLQKATHIPLLVTQDAEWGVQMRLKDVLRFPRNITLGAANRPDLVYQMGQEVAKQCKAAGVHLNFAPVVDINSNPLNPVINDRSFSENADTVTKLSLSFMKGMQSEGVWACAKHFPGHGDTHLDSHHVLPVIHKNQEQLSQLELLPFKALIQEDLKSVMLAHLSFPLICGDLPSSLSSTLVTDLLIKDMNFNGLIFTDSFEMKAISDSYHVGESDQMALLAGADLIIRKEDIEKTIAFLEAKVKENQIPLELIDQKVEKILNSKAELNLFDRPAYEKQDLSSPKAKQLKKELFQSALTLLKNDSFLPIQSHEPLTIIQVGRDLPMSQSLKLSKLTSEEQAPTKWPIFVESFEKSPRYFLPKSASDTEVLALVSQIKTSKVLVAFYEMNKFAQLNYGVESSSLKLLKELQKQNKQVGVTLFGSPYSAKLFQEMDAVLLAYENDEDAQTASYGVVKGEIEAQGIMPVTACEAFPLGYRWVQNQKGDTF